MVGSIDIRTLTLEELSGVVDLYPWYAGARMELCRRMQEAGTLGDELLQATALYLPSRRPLRDLTMKGKSVDCSDKDARRIAQSLLPSPETPERRIYVVGGDYFSQSQYNEVRQPDDSFFEKVAVRIRESDGGGGREQGARETTDDFCTETLARIYLEQGYPDEAVEIYSKLSLRYPEKSVYFATLIDEIEQKRDNK